MLGVVKSVENIQIDLAIGETYETVALSKGQNADNCVPFLTMQLVGNQYYSQRWMGDVYFYTNPARVTVQRTEAAYGRVIYNVVIVEFDPNRVRVQQKSFNIPNSGSIPQDIYEDLDFPVNTSRAASVMHYRMSSGATGIHEARYWALKGIISSSTQFRYTRYTGGGTTLAGHYYVFESLDGAFTTQSFSLGMGSGVTYDDQTITEVDLNKSWIVPCSLYCDRNHYEVSSVFPRVKFKNSTAVECDRQSGTFTCAPAGYVVTHHDDTHVDHGQFDYTSENDHQDALPDAIDTNYSAPITTFRDGMFPYLSVGVGSNYDSMMARVWYSPDNETIRAYRQATAYPGSLRWQSVEFAPAPGYYFAGYVKELGSPAVRTVRAYHRDTGELLGETTSSGVGGYYYLETTYSGEQYLVCLDNPGGDTYNLLGYDLMVPTTISGG
jgi:hypothetical protein